MSEIRRNAAPGLGCRRIPLPGLPVVLSIAVNHLPVILLLFALTKPIPAAAHGTEYQVLETARAITVECRFAGGDPMQYAEVLLFSPEEDRLEYQNGRTDQLGRFAFSPHIPGIWRMKVQDGMGHALSAEIQVDLDATPDKIAAAVGTDLQNRLLKESPAIFKAAFAVSLLFNFFLGLSVFRKKAAAGCPTGKTNKGQR